MVPRPCTTALDTSSETTSARSAKRSGPSSAKRCSIACRAALGAEFSRRRFSDSATPIGPPTREKWPDAGGVLSLLEQVSGSVYVDRGLAVSSHGSLADGGGWRATKLLGHVADDLEALVERGQREKTLNGAAAAHEHQAAAGASGASLRRDQPAHRAGIHEGQLAQIKHDARRRSGLDVPQLGVERVGTHQIQLAAHPHADGTGCKSLERKPAP